MKKLVAIVAVTYNHSTVNKGTYNCNVKSKTGGIRVSISGTHYK